MTFRYNIDFDTIKAIDFHTHAQRDSHGHHGLDPEALAAAEKYFDPGADQSPTVDDVAEHFRSRNMAAVVFTVDAYTATGHSPNSSEEIAEGAARHNDVLIPFGSVDPWQGTEAVHKAQRLIEHYGVKGFKFHPSLQAFEPNDRRFYPLYSLLSDAGVPALFHTGMTGIGAGMPGGHGIKTRYSNPMLLDDVAADFPQLKVVLAHPSVPWVDEQVAVAIHKQNVYIEISGWSAPSFPRQLVKAANSTLRDKLLFGSDYPVIGVDRWMDDVLTLGFEPDVLPLIYKENALRVLGLT